MTKHPERLIALSAATLAMSACTQQIPNSFRLAQQLQVFQTSQQVNTKIDMLWVVDNSASMDVSQKTLRAGFGAFAAQYMKPQWDIRMAAITTDTYLANPQFSNYLGLTGIGNGTVSKYLGKQSSVPYTGSTDTVAGLTSTFVNPSYTNWPTNGINSSGDFTFNATVNDLYPAYGPNWGLLSSNSQHDGPLASLCYEFNTYFFFGQSLCYIRDQSPNRGISHCVNPSGNDEFGNAEDSTTQCVNTFENDTVHSGLPIISTIPPNGTPANNAWTNALVNNFLTNLSTGSDGSGSERGMSSVLELMRDNESSATRGANANPFFRQGSIRIIVFVSDEDDQSISLDATDPLDPTPSSLVNPSDVFSGYIYTDNSANRTTNCPVTPGSGQTANCCAVKTVSDSSGSYSYIIPVCPKGYPTAASNSNSAVLMPVADVKTKFDNFFTELDGNTGSSPNYLVASIVVTTAAGVKTLHESQRCPEQQKIFGSCNEYYDVTSDRGDRYIQLADLVGGGSGSYDMTSGDYSTILTSIGQAIISQRFTFTLTRDPTNSEEMIITVLHADGTGYTVSANDYTISGNQISLNNDVIFGTNGYPGILSTDSVSINYQPKQSY
ncbi:MAG: hypothetical protein P4M08_09150 [Oligoflexia bacterium]|nr:hypothetical protein [Oligoflexia bacterium]